MTVLSLCCLNITRNDIAVAINVKSKRAGTELPESMSGKRPPVTQRVKYRDASFGVVIVEAKSSVEAIPPSMLVTVRCVLNWANFPAYPNRFVS